MADFVETEDVRFKGKEDLNIYYIDKRKDGLSLDGKWSFDFFDDFPEKIPGINELKYAATLPSSAYTNAYEAGLFPHPYADTNSKLYKNLDDKVWYFGRKFEISEDRLKRRIILCFEGVGYYCKVWINGEPCVAHEGMFAGPNAEITDLVKCGENTVVVEVLAPMFRKKDTFSFWNNEGINREIVPWNLMHDSATSNGDFTVFGIWNSVRIEFLHKYHMARPRISTEKTDLKNRKATLLFETEISDGEAPLFNHFYGKKEGTFAIGPGREYFKNDSVDLEIVIKNKKTGKIAYKSKENIRLLDLKKSFFGSEFTENQYFVKKIEIDNPKIWNPDSKEKPELYSAEMVLYHNGEVCDEQKLNVGIRTFEAEPSEGRKWRLAWNNWQFILNGRKIFIKGMNWMPLDFLYDISPEKYRTYLEMIKNQGVNMVRVWSGGGMPETDEFYDICDELGLLVWQDWFPANTISTKGWPMDVLESQTALNMYRMRKHPSLVLYSGGNEINPYTEGNAMSLFAIERLGKLLTPDVIYHQAALDMGSAHVYNDMEPVWYAKLFKDLPFLGESGIHSFPSYQTLCECITGKILKDTLDLSKPENLGTDPGLLNHFSEFSPERVPRMLSRASQMINLTKTTVEEISKATQIACYEFYQIMLQTMRKNYPVTCGAMPWAFKRPWPTVGVQVVDGLGRPLCQYYAVQNAFRSVGVMLDIDEVTLAPGEKFKIKPYILNDFSEKSWDNYEVSVKIFGPDLSEVFEANGTAETFYEIPEDFADKFFFVTVSLNEEGKTVARSSYTPKVLSKMSDAKFREEFRSKPHPNLYFDKGPWLFEQLKSGKKAVLNVKTSVKREKVSLIIENTSDVPGIYTEISCDDPEYVYVFDDNCFSILPGEVKKVTGFAVKKGKNKPNARWFAVKSINSAEEKSK